MKVLQIVKTNEGANWAFNQAKWLYDNGVEIITVLPEINGGMAEKYKEYGMKLEKADFSLPVSKPWEIAKKSKSIREIVKRIQPDLIHSHFVTNTMMIRIALKSIEIPRLFQVPGPLHLESILFRKAEVYLSNSNDYWAAACKKTRNIYVDAGISKERTFLAYYGGYGGDSCDEYEEASNILHDEYNIPNDKILVGMVSYFYKPKTHMLQFRGLKGHEDFIDAISIARESEPNIKGIIIGDAWGSSSKYVQKVKRYAQKKCGDNIVFTGFRSDMKKIYRELDVAVHPSHSENLGGAAESLAAGVPTISTNVGGFPDIVINDQTGYTVNPKSPKELGDAIIKTINSHEESHRMAFAGREFVREMLDIKRTSENILEIYNNILSYGNVLKKMYNPKVSIIIPVYNGANYLQQSIESALAQTYKNIEIIVVNDGSNDNGATEKIANYYKDRIKYFSKPNGGVSSALNFGISKMEGEWFSWLSHDDIYLNNKIEEQIKYLNDTVLTKYEIKSISNIVLYCNTEFIDDKNNIILRLKPIAREFETAREILLKNLKKNRLGGCSFLIHKSAMDDMDGFDEAIRTVSDYDLWYRLLLNDYQFFYVPLTLVQGRMHKNQVTYTMSDLSVKEFEQFHTRLLKIIDSKPEYNDYKIFYKISCYARQRGYYKSSQLGFKMMKTRCPYLVWFLLKAIGNIYSDFYRTLKKFLKKIYTSIYIK